MTRRRYPSDENRLKKKQAPHVKIHLSARSHPKLAGDWDKPEFRGQFEGLLEVAALKFAGKTGGVVHLSHTDITFISGRRRSDVALKSLRHLLDICRYSYELHGDIVVVTIPKFATKQGYGSADRVVTPRSYADSGDLQRTKEPKNQRTNDVSEPETADEAPAKREREPPGAWGIQWAERLRELVVAIYPGAQVPRTDKQLWAWALQLEAMLVAGRKWAGVERRQVEFVIEWLYSPANQDRAEYLIEVRAPSSMREKWDQIVAGIRREVARVEGSGDRGVGVIARNLRESEEGDRDGRNGEGRGGGGDGGPRSSSGAPVSVRQVVRSITGGREGKPFD